MYETPIYHQTSSPKTGCINQLSIQKQILNQTISLPKYGDNNIYGQYQTMAFKFQPQKFISTMQNASVRLLLIELQRLILAHQLDCFMLNDLQQ
jgi:hypothetical protein